MLWTSVDIIAHGLRQYGEESTAAWVIGCSDDELIRICSVADWLLLRGPATPSGASMMLVKAFASAAVYVREGAPRNLARSRRRLTRTLSPEDDTALGSGRTPDPDRQRQVPWGYGVGSDACAYWAPTGPRRRPRATGPHPGPDQAP